MTATNTRPLLPVPTFPFSMFDPVHLGVDEYGEPVYVNLAERNMLIGGEPGGGKSSAENLIVAHGALSHDCRLVLVDGNQVQLGPWRASADMFIGPSLKDATEAFTAFQQIMNDRYAELLADGRRKITRADGQDVYLVVIDEYAYYSATIGKKVPGVWRRGAPAKLGPAAGAGGHGPALLATGVLPVRQAGAVTGSRVAGGGSAVQLVRQFLV